jgi:signal transduction histidine kinase
MREKVYNAAEIGHDLPPEQRKNKGSGFGLLNCKGIIEKYRKTDALFELCQFGIDSRIGEGSRFWFRLPKGVRRLMALLCVTLFPWGASAQVQELMFSDAPQVDTLLVHAAIFADSVYFANVDGRYEEALAFADSPILYLNAHHRKYAKEYIAPLTSNRGETDVEIRWWLSDYATDYHTILDVRNEMAVANLALRRWHEYRYNNRIYNDLYILISEDRSLIDYCTRMQRYNSNISIAILICVLLALGYLAVLIYTFMERVGVVYRDIETVEDDERRVRHEENRLHVQNMVLDNCLSTIKHETIYYPNRIKQLVNRINEHDERSQMKELVDYYKVVFTTLTECASRQLDEVTFRRAVVDVGRLLQGAVAYHRKRYRNSDSKVLVTDVYEGKVTCDNDLIGYLFEQLIDAALLMSPVSELQLTVKDDGDFVRFVISSNTCTFTEDMLESLFYPSRISTGPMSDGYLQGAEYIVCRQIIREHDDNFNHIGCRIKAEPTSEGYMVWFTLPKVLA